MPWAWRIRWIRRASRGRRERPSSWVEERGLVSIVFVGLVGSGAEADADAVVGGGVAGWPLVVAMVSIVVRFLGEWFLLCCAILARRVRGDLECFCGGK